MEGKKEEKMTRAEWRSLLKNKFLLIVLGAIALIPALYNLIFLGALWDPYGKVDQLPVAIVNQDKHVSYQGKDLDLGKEVTDNLLKKKPLDFHRVSSEEAEKGISKGKYYMIVTIPEAFSKDATSLLSQHPKQMVIDYQTSQGSNLTASKMSASAITALKDQVSSQVTEMYTEAVLSNFGNAGQGMAKAATGGEKLSEGTKKLKEATQTISTNLATLSNSSLTFSDGSQTLTKGLQQYVAGAMQVNEGAGKLDQGIGTLAEKGPELANGVSRLSAGSASLTDGISQYTSGVGSVATGSQALDSGIGQLNGKLPALSQGAEQLAQGSASLNGGINQYVAGVADANTGAKKVTDGAQQLAAQTEQLPQQVKALHEGTEKIVAGLQNVQLSEEKKNQLLTYTDSVNSYISQVSQAFGAIDLSGLANVGQLTGVVKELSDQLAALSASASSMTQKMEETKQTLKQSYQTDLTTNANAVVAQLTSSGVPLTDEQKASVLSTMQAQNSQTLTAIDQLSIDTSQLTAQLAAQQQSLMKLSTALAALQGIPVDQISQLKQGADQLAQAGGKATPGLKNMINGMYTIGNQLTPGAQAINDGVGQLDANIPALTAGIQHLAEGSNRVSQGTQQLVEKGQPLSKGANQLAQGTAGLKENVPAVTGGVQQLAGGSKKVTSGAKQLAGKSSSLVNGAQQVTTGLNQLNQNIPALNTGISILHTGSQQLTQGTGQLAANGGQLVAGAQQLQNGSQKIAEGSGKLAAGENQVTHSLGTVGTGLGTLTNQLASGSKEIGQLNTGKTGANAITQPIRTTHNDPDKLANNGTGMAPYMMSVALFIGTVTFNLLFDAFKPKKKPTTGLAWWASKASILAVVSIAQALLVDAALMGLLGMDVLHPVKVVAFSILVSMTFMSIVTLFNLLLGKVGSFVMLLFMILQLAASGGTYPIELSGHFYQAVNPFLPMTYSIRALREGISIGGSMLSETLLFIALLFISNALMIVFFTKKRKNPVTFEEEWS